MTSHTGEFVIVCFDGDYEHRHLGTLDELVSEFQKVLEDGHFWNNKIPTAPKSIDKLVTALNRSAYETGANHLMYFLEVGEK